jgi:sodium transport system ATP-binding protein
MIEAQGLTKRFRERGGREICAVDEASFRCEPGRIYGLLGSNGAGKTTTLRMLATILRPTAGTARVAGYDVLESPEQVRKRVGFLSTATALYGRLTAREMVEYFARLNGLNNRRLREHVESLFARLAMDEFADRRCDQLSTGMKQRVSIARTLVHDPPVMIFDEPTAGLDVMSARAILAFIRECRNEGKTVAFSTHVMSEAEKLCDRIGIIHRGRLVAEGTLDELRARYGCGELEEIFVHLVGEGHEPA